MRIKREVKALYKNKGLKNGVQVAQIEEHKYPHPDRRIYAIEMTEKDSKGNIKRRTFFNPQGKLKMCDVGVQELNIKGWKYEHIAEQFKYDVDDGDFYCYLEDITKPQNGDDWIYRKDGKVLSCDSNGKFELYKLNQELCAYYDFPISDFCLGYSDDDNEDGKLVLYKNYRIMGYGGYTLT